jgi:hypothetical protein
MNDCVFSSFRLEIDAQNEWLLVKSPPTLKRKRSIEAEISSPSNDLDNVLRTMAQPTQSPERNSFSFQFGNKRGRPIPPRPQVISAVKVKNSTHIIFQISSFLFRLIP